LAQLISRHADTRHDFGPIHAERIEIKRLRRYIEEHYAEDIRLPDLAALVGWNPFYLLRVFRNEVGLPPHAYLEQIRIQRAQDFLRQGGAIADVAYQTGFSSQSHFTTSFRRVLGVTPGQFVKDLQL
jgi:AraC-like DNA-binding protein